MCKSDVFLQSNAFDTSRAENYLQAFLVIQDREVDQCVCVAEVGDMGWFLFCVSGILTLFGFF